MLIVDAQVHIWGANTPERPWPARNKAHRPVPFTKDELLHEMDAAGVDRTVIVPPGWEGDRNDLALEAARVYPERFAIMGRLDIESPASRGVLATWRQQPGMLGLRFTLRGKSLERMITAGHAERLWTEAEAAGVPIMLTMDYERLDYVDQVLERHPALKLVMDHLLLENGKKDEAAFADLDKLLSLAQRPNIAVKSTSMPSYTSDNYPYRRLHPYLRRVYDAFGPRRMFWGTDLTRLPCSYRQAVTMFTEEIPWLTAEDKEWIMGRGVCVWLGWKMP